MRHVAHSSSFLSSFLGGGDTLLKGRGIMPGTEVDNLLQQCGLTKYYSKLVTAGFRTFKDFDKKRDMICAVVPEAAASQILAVVDQMIEERQQPQSQGDGDGGMAGRQLEEWESVLRERLREYASQSATSMLDRVATSHPAKVSRQSILAMQTKAEHAKTMLGMCHSGQKANRRFCELTKQLQGIRNHGADPVLMHNVQEEMSSLRAYVVDVLVALAEEKRKFSQAADPDIGNHGCQTDEDARIIELELMVSNVQTQARSTAKQHEAQMGDAEAKFLEIKQELQGQVAASRTQVADTQAQLSEKATEIAFLKDALGGAQQDLSAVAREKHFYDLTAQKDELVNEALCEVRPLWMDVYRLHELFSVSEAQQEKCALEKRLGMLESELELWKNAYQQLASQTRDLKTQKDDLVVAVAAAQAENRELLGKAEVELASTSACFTAQLATAATQIVQAEEKLKTTEAQVEVAASKSKEQAAELNNVQRRVKCLESIVNVPKSDECIQTLSNKELDVMWTQILSPWLVDDDPIDSERMLFPAVALGEIPSLSYDNLVRSLVVAKFDTSCASRHSATVCKFAIAMSQASGNGGEASAQAATSLKGLISQLRCIMSCAEYLVHAQAADESAPLLTVPLPLNMPCGEAVILDSFDVSWGLIEGFVGRKMPRKDVDSKAEEAKTMEEELIANQEEMMKIVRALRSSVFCYSQKAFPSSFAQSGEAHRAHTLQPGELEVKAVPRE